MIIPKVVGKRTRQNETKKNKAKRKEIVMHAKNSIWGEYVCEKNSKDRKSKQERNGTKIQLTVLYLYALALAGTYF